MKFKLSKKPSFHPAFLLLPVIALVVWLYTLGILDWTNLPRNLSAYKTKPKMFQTIYIQPFGKVDLLTLDYLKKFLEEDSGKFAIFRNYKPIPKEAYGRPNQVNAEVIHKTFLPDGVLPNDCLRVVAITSEDLYSGDLNYVLGLAEGPKDCVISTFMLWPVDENDKPIKNLEGKSLDLYQTRLRKILRHELGHTFGLRHCFRLKCVMRFANTVAQQDRQDEFYCPHCARILANQEPSTNS